MKRWIFVLICTFFNFAFTPDNNKDIVHQTLPFKRGEILKYRVHYGYFDAGIAQIEIKKEQNRANGRDVMHIVGTGISVGAFDWFFKVRDRYESYIDAHTMQPLKFIRRVNEGGYIINQDYVFLPEENKVKTETENVYEIPEGTQDMLSAFYYARTFNFDTAKPGDVYTILSFVDEEVYPLKIKFLGRENKKVNGKTYKCIKFCPVVQKGRIFKHEEDMLVWVTDDKNKIPVMAQAKILVGSIKMELDEYSGLAHPLAVAE